MADLKDRVISVFEEEEAEEKEQRKKIDELAMAAQGIRPGSDAALALTAAAEGGKKEISWSNNKSNRPLSSQAEEIFEECADNFVGVAAEAVAVLSLIVTSTLQKLVKDLFSPQWLRDGGDTRRIIATLSDYFSDYRRQISREAYFAQIAKKVLNDFINEYLRKFIAEKPTPSEELFRRLKEDQEMLSKFFQEYTDLIANTYLQHQLAVLGLVELVLSNDAEFLPVLFPKIVQRFPTSAIETMDGLMQVRQDLSRAQRKEILDLFQQKINELKQGGTAVAASAASISSGGGTAAMGGYASVLPPPVDTSSPTLPSSDELNVKTSFWDVFKSKVAASKEKHAQKNVKRIERTQRMDGDER